MTAHHTTLYPEGRQNRLLAESQALALEHANTIDRLRREVRSKDREIEQMKEGK